MTDNKVSEAQRRATKNWEKNNPERKRYLRYRSNARTFVRHWAVDADVAKLLEIVDTQSKQIALDTVNKDKEKKFIEAGYTTTENLQENNQNEKQENKKTFFEKFKDFFK